MLDTGGHTSVLDIGSARTLGLDVEAATDGKDFGTYYSPGYDTRRYAGIARGPIPIRFSQEVELCVPYIKLIDSEVPVVLLGADVLAGGRARGWDFTGMRMEVNGSGKASGWITFKGT